MQEESDTNPTLDDATLEPPGTIAVVGAGPLGIEAALYGRFLGYDVTLYEAGEVAGSLAADRDQPIPMLPDRCVSTLARSAIDAQEGGDGLKASPLQIGEWIDQVWIPLTETDLLRGRLRCPLRVRSIELVPADSDDGETDGELPPDFRLTADEGAWDDFEAVILATGQNHQIELSFPLPADYFFQIASEPTGSAEADFLGGLKRVVAIYASLAGRSDLDLYQPLRG